MASKEPKKMNLESMNVAEDQKRKLKGIFPNIFNEDKVDIDRLKLTLGESVDSGQERYGMTWPGKAECMKIIQQPSIGTLKPAKKESINFNTTENLFIEGDNLEALKLLQNSYYGKVKMIYIDPPYNTGKEFIYPDKYTESLETYLAYTGQIDDDGKKFSTNTEADGRFHTKWLNMMYPRLYLARNLLRDDGVIFISIDDNEATNLQKICDEIFGENNFIAQLAVQLNPRGRHLDKFIAKTHESILVFGKDCENPNTMIGMEKGEEMISEYDREDGRGKYRNLGLRNRNQAFNPTTRPKLYYPLYINPKDGTVSIAKSGAYTQEIWPDAPDGTKTCWTWGKEKADKDKSLLIAEKSGSEWRVYRKDYLLNEEGELATTLPKSIWDDKEINNDYGRKAIKDLLGHSVMDFPKAPALLKKIIEIGAGPNDIILDFFAGSATTAHAALDLNVADAGQRKFILVQLPEPCSQDSVAFKAGYKTIAEIGKDRIRSVIKEIESEKKRKKDESKETLFHEKDDIQKRLDLGFKVFKLDKSNFKVWESNIEERRGMTNIEKQLELHIDHIDPKATTDDILYELLLKSGYPLTTKVEERSFSGKKVYLVEDGTLLICLEKELTKELITEMARLEPARVVCLDQGFAGNDQLKTNAVQIMKSHEVNDFRTV